MKNKKNKREDENEIEKNEYNSKRADDQANNYKKRKLNNLALKKNFWKIDEIDKIIRNSSYSHKLIQIIGFC